MNVFCTFKIGPFVPIKKEPSWIYTELLIILQAMKHDKVWKKKISAKNLRRAKPSQIEQETDRRREGRAGEWVSMSDL